MAMRRFQMYLTEKQYLRLMALLEGEEEESLARLIRRAVEEFLAREEAKKTT